MAKAAYHRTAFLGALILLGTLPAARAGWLNQLKSRTENAVQGAAQHMTNDATGASSSRPAPGTPSPTPTPAATQSPASGSTSVNRTAAHSEPVAHAHPADNILAKLKPLPPGLLHGPVVNGRLTVAAVCPMPAAWKPNGSQTYRSGMAKFAMGQDAASYESSWCSQPGTGGQAELCRCLHARLKKTMSTLARISDENVRILADHLGFHAFQKYGFLGIKFGMSQPEAVAILKKKGFTYQANASQYNRRTKNLSEVVRLSSSVEPGTGLYTIMGMTYVRGYGVAGSVKINLAAARKAVIKKYGPPHKSFHSEDAFRLVYSGNVGGSISVNRHGTVNEQFYATRMIHTLNRLQNQIAERKRAEAERKKPTVKVGF